MNDIRIAEIVHAFELYDGIYKRAEVEAALELQEQITPHLIAILEGLLAAPEAYASKKNYFAHIYALILLAHFREQAAHRVMIELFSLPSKVSRQLFGSILTETLPALLLSTSGGDLALIESLVLNKQANEYCRGSALQAMVLAVADGMIAREEVLGFFGSLFTGDEADLDSIFWDQLACCVCDLYPEELMGMIEQAYNRGLIAHDFIHYKDFLHTLRAGKQQALRRLQDKLRHRLPNDVHGYMSWWASFKLVQGGVNTCTINNC